MGLIYMCDTVLSSADSLDDVAIVLLQSLAHIYDVTLSITRSLEKLLCLAKYKNKINVKI